MFNGGLLLVSVDSFRYWFLNYIFFNFNFKDLKERFLLFVIDFNVFFFYFKNDVNFFLVIIELIY